MALDEPTRMAAAACATRPASAAAGRHQAPQATAINPATSTTAIAGIAAKLSTRPAIPTRENTAADTGASAISAASVAPNKPRTAGHTTRPIQFPPGAGRGPPSRPRAQRTNRLAPRMIPSDAPNDSHALTSTVVIGSTNTIRMVTTPRTRMASGANPTSARAR